MKKLSILLRISHLTVVELGLNLGLLALGLWQVIFSFIPLNSYLAWPSLPSKIGCIRGAVGGIAMHSLCG